MTKKLLSIAALAAITVALALGQGPGLPENAPAEVQACVALGDPAEIRACLQELRGEGEARPNNPRRAIARFLMVHYLEFTDEQIATAQALRQEAQAALSVHREPLRANGKAIREAVQDGLPVDALADEQGRLIAELIKSGAGVAADAKTRLNLTIEQQEKIERLQEMLPDMAPGGFAGPGRRPGR